MGLLSFLKRKRNAEDTPPAKKPSADDVQSVRTRARQRLIGAMVLLSLHLSHGIYSLFQHLGAWGKEWTPFIKTGALVVGYGLCAAFAAIPLSVYLGFIK